MIRSLSATLTVCALLAAALPSLAQAPPPAPNPGASGSPNAPANAPPTTPPLSTPLPAIGPPTTAPQAPGAPAATPTPSGALLQFTGQLLDLRNGYVYFTTGDAFKVATAVRFEDYATGKPTELVPQPKLFARATLDPKSHEVVELDLTKKFLPHDASYAQAEAFAVAKSSAIPNPELVGGRPITGKEVPVAFVIEVPPTTPMGADVYISTDVSQWNPQAIKLNRIDATHYRTVIRFASGTRLAFKITRGSWQTQETDERGLEAEPTHFFVREIDSQLERHVVYHWADETGSGSVPINPGALPTPFNPNPFPQGGIFPGGNTRPAGAPTPAGCPPNLPNCH
ncbi:MAG TPA: hypothetical protein VMA36_21780 [Candidatus Limnocylindria bacterium]|nr:hypothetical protein [Candidatus Limnocylindria bacterium]